MDSDVFERFEKTRGGLLIPMLLFLVGAVATVFAIETVHGIATEQLESSEPTGPIEEDAGSVDVDGVPNTDSPRGDVASDTVVPERGQPNL